MCRCRACLRLHLWGPVDCKADRIAQAIAGAREEGARREWERGEVSRAGACDVIEQKYGGDSSVWKDVHGAFCGLKAPVPRSRK